MVISVDGVKTTGIYAHPTNYRVDRSVTCEAYGGVLCSSMSKAE